MILFVGDGMGVSTITAARIREGQLLGGTGEEHALYFERFPYLSMIKTYNTNQQTPDSAGTMTAMMTGVKTLAGVISVGPSATRRDCESSLAARLRTLLEEAEDAGWWTGVIATARLTHATPAAAYAHAAERGWEDDSALSNDAREKGCTDIASQLIDFPHGDGLEVALGGGRRAFLPAQRDGQPYADPEFPELTGRRLDGRHLGEEWVSRHPRSAWVWNADQFNAINPRKTRHLLGIFNPSHMQYEADRAADRAGEPSLSEMTAKAIDILKRGPKGFLLIVEGGRIDHAHHATNAYRALADVIELARAVEVADRKTADKDTLLIVTADHSHTMTIAGYPTRGNPILDVVRGNDWRGQPTGAPTLAEDGQPYTTLGYQNGRGGRLLEAGADAGGDEVIYSGEVLTERRLDLAGIETGDPGFHQESLIPTGAETHGAEDVALYAKGPMAHLFRRTHEQSYIYYVMRHAARLDRKPRRRR